LCKDVVLTAAEEGQGGVGESIGAGTRGTCQPVVEADG